MVRHTNNPSDLPMEVDDTVVLFPTRETPRVLAEVPALSAVLMSTVGQAGATTRVIRQVVVIEIAGLLGEVVEDLDRALELALADAPRGVVCDLSAVILGADPVPVEMLATLGRHVRDWPGIPVAVACADLRVRETLAADPLGSHLIVTTSLFTAMSAVLTIPALTVERLRLAPHPTAPRAAREFMTRTLLDWRLSRVIPFATLVVSELVASSSLNTGTDIDVSVAWSHGILRLSVRDHRPGLLGRPSPAQHLQGRRLAVVAGLSRAFGVMPADDGGKVVWAVLEAPRPRPSTRRVRPARAPERQDSPVFTDGRGLAELPFPAGTGEPSTSDPHRPTPGVDQPFFP